MHELLLLALKVSVAGLLSGIGRHDFSHLNLGLRRLLSYDLLRVLYEKAAERLRRTSWKSLRLCSFQRLNDTLRPGRVCRGSQGLLSLDQLLLSHARLWLVLYRARGYLGCQVLPFDGLLDMFWDVID